jgi:hypothetical protein
MLPVNRVHALTETDIQTMDMKLDFLGCAQYARAHYFADVFTPEFPNVAKL